MKQVEKILKKKKYTKIKLKKIATNHLELKAKLNGIKGRFILDTGASNSCVGIDLKDRFLLDAKESDTKAAGAGATDMETQLAENNKQSSSSSWSDRRNNNARRPQSRTVSATASLAPLTSNRRQGRHHRPRTTSPRPASAPRASFRRA